jgi:GDP-L-fucose synthase
MELDKKTYDQQTDPMQSHINVGFGSDVTIAELAAAVGQAVGYEGAIGFDATKPDGPPRKSINSSLLNRLGWGPKVKLQQGLILTYADFKKLQFI